MGVKALETSKRSFFITNFPLPRLSPVKKNENTTSVGLLKGATNRTQVSFGNNAQHRPTHVDGQRAKEQSKSIERIVPHQIRDVNRTMVLSTSAIKTTETKRIDGHHPTNTKSKCPLYIYRYLPSHQLRSINYVNRHTLSVAQVVPIRHLRSPSSYETAA